MAQRLTDKHPLSQKVEKLMQFLEENKLFIFVGYDGLYIEDTEVEIAVALRDADDGSALAGLPTMFEYKLIITEK